MITKGSIESQGRVEISLESFIEEELKNIRGFSPKEIIEQASSCLDEDKDFLLNAKDENFVIPKKSIKAYFDKIMSEAADKEVEEEVKVVKKKPVRTKKK